MIAQNSEGLNCVSRAAGAVKTVVLVELCSHCVKLISFPLSLNCLLVFLLEHVYINSRASRFWFRFSQDKIVFMFDAAVT